MADSLKDLNRKVSSNQMETVLKQYRSATDSQVRSRLEVDLRTLVYAFVYQNLGVTYSRSEKAGAHTGERVGRIAKALGIADPAAAEVFAEKVFASLDDKTNAAGGVLNDWRESGGASLASYILGKASLVAHDIGIDTLTDLINLKLQSNGRNLPQVRSLLGLHDAGQQTTLRVRDTARELVNWMKQAKKDGRRDEVEKVMNFLLSGRPEPVDDPDDEGDGAPGLVPEGLKTLDSPLSSPLRVSALVQRLRVVGEEMDGASLDYEGKQIGLGVNHRNIWNAYLGLTPEAHAELDLTIEELAEARGWDSSQVKNLLAECFAFVLIHPKLEEILDLWSPSSLTKHSDKRKLQEFRSDVLTSLGDDRSNLKKLLQIWIARYLMK
jgi:hypothetical protein